MKIKVQPSSSGTGVVTLSTTSGSDTDRTITLPDSSVTLGAATPSIADNGTTTSITLTSDGRGISDFTAQAWVNFDGTTNVAGNCSVQDSHNVSSVSDDGTGSYTINFSNTLANTDYMAQGDHNNPSGHQQNVFIRGVYTTTQLHLETSNTTYVDVSRCNVIVFGG
jgi:hypothetical protein